MIDEFVLDKEKSLLMKIISSLSRLTHEESDADDEMFDWDLDEEKYSIHCWSKVICRNRYYWINPLIKPMILVLNLHWKRSNRMDSVKVAFVIRLWAVVEAHRFLDERLKTNWDVDSIRIQEEHPYFHRWLLCRNSECFFFTMKKEEVSIEFFNDLTYFDFLNFIGWIVRIKIDRR